MAAKTKEKRCTTKRICFPIIFERPTIRDILEELHPHPSIIRDPRPQPDPPPTPILMLIIHIRSSCLFLQATSVTTQPDSTG